jgi:hypothetical protein
MLKVAAVCIDTSSEPRLQGKDDSVNWRPCKIGPDAFQHRIEFHLVFELELV